MSGLPQPMLRLDTATALRRFWHLERALILALGGWVPSVQRLETKAALARAAWESSLTADALRERFFELRYPDRDLEREPDASLVALFEMVIGAPDPHSFLRAAADTFIPALRDAYHRYLALSDEIADGPTYRFLKVAIEDKARQSALFDAAAAHEISSEQGTAWVQAMTQRMEQLGGVPVGSASSPAAPFEDPGITYEVPDVPARDDRYLRGRFYWPDNFDPSYPYGEGVQLQLRTAISHLNEVWAVETAGAILFDLGPRLAWEFIMDAARWLYDESRHMTMGRVRLERWGFESRELPLGTFIYGSCAGTESTYRLGMLAFFETKNIGKKAKRAATFGELGDTAGQRDMEFDWADEAIHAGYGRRWLKEAMVLDGRSGDEWPDLVLECESLVAQHIADASEQERSATRRHAAHLIDKAEIMVASTEGGT